MVTRRNFIKMTIGFIGSIIINTGISTGYPESNMKYVLFEDKSNISEQCTYEWDFGDGVSCNTKDAIHGYVPGTYMTKHKITNNCGVSSIKEKELVIT